MVAGLEFLVNKVLENEVAAPQVLRNMETIRLRTASNDMLAQKRMYRIMSSKEEREQTLLSEKCQRTYE